MEETLLFEPIRRTDLEAVAISMPISLSALMTVMISVYSNASR